MCQQTFVRNLQGFWTFKLKHYLQNIFNLSSAIATAIFFILSAPAWWCFPQSSFMACQQDTMSAGTLCRRRWVPGAANPLMLVPPHCHGFLSHFTLHTHVPNPQDNRMAPHELHDLQLCPLTAYFKVFIKFFPLLVLWNGDYAIAWRDSFCVSDLRAQTRTTKMVFSIFF